MDRVQKVSLHFSPTSTPTPKSPKVIITQHSPYTTGFMLNRPKALNSVDHEMIRLMQDELKIWHRNPEKAPRVLIMTGAG